MPADLPAPREGILLLTGVNNTQGNNFLLLSSRTDACFLVCIAVLCLETALGFLYVSRGDRIVTSSKDCLDVRWRKK